MTYTIRSARCLARHVARLKGRVATPVPDVTAVTGAATDQPSADESPAARSVLLRALALARRLARCTGGAVGTAVG
eukprot:329563-Pleurochrysis_carterae.AAC.4